MELVCKCHGVSGSCSMRVCWRRLKPFREIGDLLTSKFDGATLVKAVERRHKIKLRPVRKNVKRPSKKDLVYLDESPDYCLRNETWVFHILYLHFLLLSKHILYTIQTVCKKKSASEIQLSSLNSHGKTQIPNSKRIKNSASLFHFPPSTISTSSSTRWKFLYCEACSFVSQFKIYNKRKEKWIIIKFLCIRILTVSLTPYCTAEIKDS